MKYTRILLLALTVSLAACGDQITGPDTSPPPPSRVVLDGVGTLGSGT